MRIKSEIHAGNINKRGKVKPSLVNFISLSIFLFFGREKPTPQPIPLVLSFWDSLFLLLSVQVIINVLYLKQFSQFIF